jgi:hypothetical protein
MMRDVKVEDKNVWNYQVKLSLMYRSRLHPFGDGAYIIAPRLLRFPINVQCHSTWPAHSFRLVAWPTKEDEAGASRATPEVGTKDAQRLKDRLAYRLRRSKPVVHML